jgi:hypothetical protein
MDQQELKSKIDQLAGMISKAAATAPALTKAEKQMAEALALGLEVVGELFVDFKRIADAMEAQRHDHCPEGSVLATQDGIIRAGYQPEPGESPTLPSTGSGVR